MSVKFFTNCNVVDVVNEKVYAGSVLVDGSTIKEVGENLACPEGAQVIDLGGKTLVPGFFNCHTHMCMEGDPDPKYGESDAQLTMMALKNLKKLVNSGCTFIRDVGGMNYIDVDIRNEAAKGGMVAPDMQVSGKCICMTGGHGWSMGREADGPDDCRKAAREQLRAGADWVKVMATGGVMTKGVEPGSPQLNEDELRAAIEEAHKAGAKTCTHAQGMTGIKNALRAGIDSIEHGFFMDDWCFDWMKEHNVFFVPTLAAMYWIKVNGTEAGIPEFAVRKVENTFDAHIDTFQRAYKAGVKIALGTRRRHPVQHPRQDRVRDDPDDPCRDEQLDALRAGTLVSAELCSVKDTLGSIEPGKRANFAVLAKNPVEDIEAVMDCRMTVVGGEVLYEA